MTDPLPKREGEVLAFIVRIVREQGCPPTVRQVAEHLGHTSPSSAQVALRNLAEAGYVKESSDRKVIRLTDKARQAVGIPIIGTVPAGKPIFAYEHYQGALSLDSQFKSLDGLFALRVKGWSMRDAGIRDGDYVIVREQPVVDGGDIGVAFKGDEATVKKINRLKTGWKLEPANPEFESENIPWTASIDGTFRIGGKVVGLFRRL